MRAISILACAMMLLGSLGLDPMDQCKQRCKPESECQIATCKVDPESDHVPPPIGCFLDASGKKTCKTPKGKPGVCIFGTSCVFCQNGFTKTCGEDKPLPNNDTCKRLTCDFKNERCVHKLPPGARCTSKTLKKGYCSEHHICVPPRHTE